MEYFIRHLAGQWTLGHARVLDIMREIETASPRVTIMVGVALIDDCLTGALSAYVAIQEQTFTDRCFGEFGSMRDLAQKIDLGAAFGMYGLTTHSDLHKLREMRNEAAHRWRKKAFGSATVKGLCHDLKLPDIEWLRANQGGSTSARARFIYTVSLVTDFLMIMAFLAREADGRPRYRRYNLP
jgi:hypothetical protein